MWIEFVVLVVLICTIFGGNLSPFAISPILAFPSGVTMISTKYPSFVVTS